MGGGERLDTYIGELDTQLDEHFGETFAPVTY